MASQTMIQAQGGQRSAKECQILDGAAIAFAQHGYSGTSMSLIALTAGVSKGTLYNYFASKEDLFAAFVKRECTQRLSPIFDELDSGTSAYPILLHIGRRLVDMLLSDSGLLVYRMVAAEAHKFPELSKAFYDVGHRQALNLLKTLITQISKSCQLCVEDPDFAAEQLFSLMQSGVVLKRRLEIVASVTDEEREQVVRGAALMFLHCYNREVSHSMVTSSEE